MIRIKESELRELIKKHLKEELNEAYMYDCWNKLSIYSITEGLTITYSINKILGILNRKYNFESMNAKLTYFDDNRSPKINGAPFKNNSKTTRDDDNWYKISIYFKFGVKDNSKIVYDIIHTCDACGWFLSDVTYYHRNGFVQNIDVKNENTVDFNDDKLKNTPVNIIFRAKFNAEYKPKSVPAFLYHVCPTRVVDKILRQGLKPMNKNRIASHPKRVYLFVDYNSDWEDEIASNFRISGDDEPYSYLKIDTRKINPKIKFFYDSNVMGGNPAIYTYEPIPPTAIRLINSQDS